MSSPNPPPDGTASGSGLDDVQRAILLGVEPKDDYLPVPQQTGATATAAGLEAELKACRAAGNDRQESELALRLSRHHFENNLDLDLAVQLLHRALEVQDDRKLRNYLAGRLSAMGRHLEAGHVLRGGQPQDTTATLATWLQAGEAYARAGEADEAIMTFREASLVSPQSPIPFERIATLTTWAPHLVPPERAADAWLEAANRHGSGSEPHALCILRSFESCPSYARGAEAHARLLTIQGRHGEADEVWRGYGLASGHRSSVALQRCSRALKRKAFAPALAAALEACIAANPRDSKRSECLDGLLTNERFQDWARAASEDGEPLTKSLLTAARTKSSMGRAESFRKLAARHAGELRATLLTTASEAYSAAGNRERAVQTSHEACSVAPWLPLVHAQLLASCDEEELTPADLERCLGRLPARSQAYELAARRFSSHGEHQVAAMWTLRVIALRPGDAAPLGALVERALTTEGHATLVDAIAVAIESPRPWRDLAIPLSKALDTLAASEPQAAREAARRVLSTVGPGDDELFESITALAHRTGDLELELNATLHHAAGESVDDPLRAAAYLNAAELTLEQGRPEAAAVHVARASECTGTPLRITEVIQRIAEALGSETSASDARLALALANAWTAAENDAPHAAAAWRQLGAARWDLAGDVAGAEEAFFMACTLDAHTGAERYARDLADRGGAARAFPLVLARAGTVEQDGDDTVLCGRLFAAAALVAEEAGLNDLALDAAVAAVRVDANRADAVGIVERVASNDSGGIGSLNFVYDILAESALGRYGYRAAHYRAARQLERVRAYDDALKHAIAAFEAIPSMGASLRVLLRLAARSSNEAGALRALVAHSEGMEGDRQAAWLAQAALHAQRMRVSPMLQVELLSRALAIAPTEALFEPLKNAVSALPPTLLMKGGRAEGSLRRLKQSIANCLGELNEPTEAHFAIALATLAGGSLHDADLAVKAISRAVTLDQSQADFAPVFPLIPTLASERGAARRLMLHINEAHAGAVTLLEGSLKELRMRLHLGLSDVPPAPIQSNRTDAPNDSVQSPESEPVASLHTLAPLPLPDGRKPSRRRTRAAGDSGPPISAPPISAPPSQRTADSIPPGWRPASLSVTDSGAPSQRSPDSEAPLSYPPSLKGSDSDVPTPPPITLQGPQGPTTVEPSPSSIPPPMAEHESPKETAPRAPAPREPAPQEPAPQELAPIETAAQEPAPTRATRPDDDFAGHDEDSPGETLDYPSTAAAASAALVAKAPEELQEKPQAAVLAEPANAVKAPEASATDAKDGGLDDEALARKRGDYPAIARLLAQRAVACTDPEERRLIQLRLAAVLEQRLDRTEEACEQLQRLLEARPDDSTALRYLADLRDRQQRYTRAAKLWLRASKLARGTEQKVRDVIRCCGSLLAAGQAETAKKLIDATRGLPQSAELDELRTAVARRLDDALELDLVMDELAQLAKRTTSRPPPAPADGSEKSAEPASEAGDADNAEPSTLADAHARASVADVQNVASRPEATTPPGQFLGLRHRSMIPEFASSDEEDLFDELVAGSYEAGQSLVAKFDQSGNRRSRDVLTVRRWQAFLRRGDLVVLTNLRLAAATEGAQAFVRSIEHVLQSFAGGAPQAAPPLDALVPQPEASSKLLFGGLDGTINEALAIVWESGMIRRSLDDYRLSGRERVNPTAATPVAETFASLSRILDLKGARLFRHSAGQEAEASVALVSPLGALFSAGDAPPQELAYALGSALAAATPMLALALGLEEPELASLTRALIAGFGPIGPDSVATSSSGQMRIAEDLWHILPQAADRRLRSLCEDNAAMLPATAIMNARQVKREAGLFACGDFITAVTSTCIELDLDCDELEGDALRVLCEHPAVANLYDLALRPEYAEARWHT